MKRSFEDLRNGVVLSELGGYGNGTFCERYGRGAVIVIMGTYIIDSAKNIYYPPEFIFKPGRKNYQSYLNEQVNKAKKSGAKVAVIAIGSEITDIAEFLAVAEQAGADFVSLCAHSAMEFFTRQKLGYKLCMPENRNSLKKWISGILSATTKPLILKPGSVWHDCIIDSVKIAAELGVPIIHANLGLAYEPQGLETIRKLSRVFDFIIAGGGITGLDGARLVLNAGAGAVSVSKAAIQDQNFIEQLSKELKD